MTMAEIEKETVRKRGGSGEITTDGNFELKKTLDGGIVTSNNNMNSRINKQLDQLPENLRFNGKTPSGKPRLFVCQVCTRAFARQEHLTRHERSHTKEKPYSCGICHRKFSRRDLLLRHAHKIHGGNYGDTILKREGQRKSQQQQGQQDDNWVEQSPRNKSSKKKKTATNVTKFENSSPKMGKISRFKIKRRVSYSAQSGSYVAPIQNQETHKLDRIKFSTPELLPVDFKNFNPENLRSVEENNKNFDNERNYDTNGHDNVNESDLDGDVIMKKVDEHMSLGGINDSPNNAFNSEIPNLKLDTPSEFNLLDQVNWINDYNDTTMPFSESTSGTASETIMHSSEADHSPTYELNDSSSYTRKNNGSVTATALPLSSSSIPPKNGRTSSWSVKCDDGGSVQIKSLFMNCKSPSPESINNNNNGGGFNVSRNVVKMPERYYIGSVINNDQNGKSNNRNIKNNIDNNNNSNIEGSSNWFQVSGSNTTDDIINKANEVITTPTTNVLSGAVTTSEVQPDLDFNDLTSLTKEVQSIFNRFIQDEEIYGGVQSYGTRENINFLNSGKNDATKPSPSSEKHANTQSHSKSYGLSNNYSFYGIDYSNLANISRASPPDSSESGDVPLSKIFTTELRDMCLKALNYYNKFYSNSGSSDPILSSKELLLPNCRELNYFVSCFQEHFNTHHTFIHPDFFNLELKSLKKYVNERCSNDGYDNENSDGKEASDHNNICDNHPNDVDNENDEFLQYSNIVCLPLFIATIGSLYKVGCNSKTIELYESSRRVLHVYLERRKEQKQGQMENENKKDYPLGSTAPHPLPNSNQKVWLIQSLTLSIVFALFSDYSKKDDTEIIKRQVSAVCSIVRNNFLNIISYSFNEERQDDEKKIKPNFLAGGVNANKVFEFSNFNTSLGYIMFESKIRTTLMVYKFCQFLRIFYQVESKLFLTERDIESICIPDDESTWHKASLLIPVPFIKKKYTSSFQKFYHSFNFNSSGIHPIPEALASTMLYYEFNASTFSNFHVFLTRIDTKKLENNLPVLEPQIQVIGGVNDHKRDYSLILARDATKLRNFLMTMVFFSKIDINFGSKIWHSQIKDVYEYFLCSKHFNVLTKGSYSLLTDFLVALNFSIKNIANLLKLINNGTLAELNKKNLSLFNLQGFYYNFLVIIKFINDFESTPNFKLLCIYTELKKLANNLLIPHFSKLYPDEFSKFEDIALTSEFLHQHARSDLKTCLLTINTEKLEKLINNVLVYSFNDASFLNMTEQTTNEFSFNNNYPTYLPTLLSNSSTSISSNYSEGYGLLNQDQQQWSFEEKKNDPLVHNINDNDNNNHIKKNDGNTYNNKNNNTSNNDNDKIGSGTYDNPQIKTQMESLLHRNNSSGGICRQGFADRYHLSDKYISIAICFWRNVKETYVHSHILDKMTNDFKQLERCIDKEREHFIMKKLLRKEDNNNDDEQSILKNNSCLGSTETDDKFSKDLIKKFLQPKV